MKIAIITGASSGLGGQYAALADREGGYGEIWLIARRKERLEALAGTLETRCRILAYDLTQQSSFDGLSELLESEKPEVRLLVNAAGFGKIGEWDEIERSDCDAMIELNCRAAVDLTQLVLPHMTRGARIMEICSTAAFQPFQYLGVYAASKAFLFSYSRSLRVELFSRGIKVTSVCPYWIKDTEFIRNAKRTGGAGRIRHFPLASAEKTVAAVSYNDSRLGFAVSTPGIICTAHRLVCKVVPHELMMGVWALLRRV